MTLGAIPTWGWDKTYWNYLLFSGNIEEPLDPFGKLTYLDRTMDNHHFLLGKLTTKGNFP